MTTMTATDPKPDADRPETDEGEFVAGGPPQPRSGARLVVVEQLAWQQDDDDGVPLHNGFAAQIESSERPYLRRLTVGEGWAPLDAGWIGADAKTVWIANAEGKRLAANPTPEDAAETAKKVLIVARRGGEEGSPVFVELVEVPPGQHARLRLAFPFAWLRVRCASSFAKVDAAVFAG